MRGLFSTQEPSRSIGDPAKLLARLSIRHIGMILAFVPLFFVVVLVLVVATFNRQTQASEWWAERSFAVVNVAERLQASVAEAESGARGFAFTGNYRFINSYATARRRVPAEIRSLMFFVAGDQSRMLGAKVLAQLATVRMAGLSKVVTLASSGRRSVAESAISAGSALRQSARLNALVERFVADETVRESRRLNAQRALWNVTGWLFAGAAAAALALSFAMTELLRRRTRTRLSAVRKKAAQLESGEPLDDPLSKDDEIAELDRFMHRTATEVARRLETMSNYQQLLNSAQDIIWVSRLRDGSIVEVNQAAVNAFGYDWDEFLALNVGDLLDQDAVARRKDGSTFPVESSTQSAEINGESVLLSVVRDVSERRRVECALTEARDRAMEAYRLKSEFLANMSHEIRTPMTAVIGATELLLATSLTGEQREYVELLRRSSDTLLGIISDILDFSKLEAGKADLETTEFAPVSLVEGAIDMLAPQAATKKLSLMSYVDPGIPKLLVGDPAKVRQILLNLVGNAVKFTDEGGVLIHVSPAVVREDHIVLRFEVTDTGIGLSDAGRSRLFEPFSQAEGSTTRRFGGTGLGLAICKRLAELMGGDIGVSSREGAGSTFWFTAPLERLASEPEGPVAESLLSLTKALVVGADTSAFSVVAKYLASWGITVSSAQSVEGATQALRHDAAAGDPFDVVVIDDPSGDILDNRVRRRLLDEPNVPVPHFILLVPFDGTSSAARATGAGFDALVTKPIRQAQLFDAVATVMQRSNYRPIAFLDRSRPAQPRSAIANGQRADMRILVAEDNPVNQRLALRQLEKLGFSAVAANDGIEAVNAYKTGSYALIFMDCQMPELDGFDATRAIRRHEARRGGHVPIVAMTANALEGDREACIAAGMDDYLSKPVRLDAMLAAINRWAPRSEEPPAPAEVRAALAVSRLREVFGDDDEGIRELLGVAVVSLESLVARARTAVDEADMASLATVAHELKGSCANVGADDMARTSVRIEEAVADVNLDAAADLVKELESAFGRVRSHVASLPAGLRPQGWYADRTIR